MKVFISGSVEEDIDEKYISESKKYAVILSNNYDLVFSGTAKGIFKGVYEVFKNNNKEIYAIAPKLFKDDLNDIESNNKIIVDDEREQYKYFVDSDLIVVLPGGFGTLSELFYIINNKRNDLIKADVILVNINGYYDDVINLLEKVYKAKFSKQKGIIKVINNPSELEELI